MRRLAVLVLAVLGASALLVTAYLYLDSPTKAAAQWADAVKSGNTSAALDRTCQRMQEQVKLLQTLSVQVEIATRSIRIPGGLGRVFIDPEPVFYETERSGAHARVVFLTNYETQRHVGNTAVVGPEDRGQISEYWNMTREGWGLTRWKWCGYGGLAQ